jgi:dTDP-4-amino-4,6-dideoxygalactose transaminase
MVGSFSDLTMFSFDPIKTITCIDGGALVIRSDADAQAAETMRLLGMSQSTNSLYQNARAQSYDIATIGFRYHMANLHAAIGLAQLAKIDVIAESRRSACRRYNDGLSDVAQVRVPMTDFSDVTPFLYYIRVPAAQRNALRIHLGDRGIETGIHWQPGHQFTLFRNCRRGDLAVTERVGQEVLSLPLHSCMAAETIDRVIDGIRGFYQRPS